MPTQYVLMEVLTSRVLGDPNADEGSLARVNHAKFREDYPIRRIHDQTGQTEVLYDPNLMMLEALVTEQVFLKVVKDAIYPVLNSVGGIQIKSNGGWE